jgi:hypothetical protein
MVSRTCQKRIIHHKFLFKFDLHLVNIVFNFILNSMGKICLIKIHVFFVLAA